MFQLTFSHLKTRTAVITVCLLLAAGAAVLAAPKLTAEAASVDIESTAPARVSGWQMIQSPAMQVGVTTTANDINQPYDQTVMRTYLNNEGKAIHLALAWGRHQRQEVKIHRPELCYPAQGLAVKDLRDVQFPLQMPDGRTVIGKRMIAHNSAGQAEVVSYWIRIGSSYSSNALQTRWHIMQQGLKGEVTDGILVRVSQRIANDQDFEAAFRQQEQFVVDLYKASPAPLQHLLAR